MIKKITIFMILIMITIGCSAIPGMNDDTSKVSKKADQANTLSLLALGNGSVSNAGASGTNGSNGTNANVTYSGVRVTSSSDISVGNTTYTFLTFNSIDYDTSSFFSGSGSNKLTIPVSGYYVIESSVTWNANVTGIRKINIIKNDPTSPIVLGTTSSSAVSAIDPTSITVSTISKFNAGDTLKLQVYQSSGGNLTIAANSYNPIFSAYKISN